MIEERHEAYDIDKQVVRELIEGGPAYLKNHINDFCNHLKCLMESANNLYTDDQVLGISGVYVDCRVYIGNDEILKIGFGSTGVGSGSNEEEKEAWIKKNVQRSENQELGMN